MLEDYRVALSHLNIAHRLALNYDLLLGVLLALSITLSLVCLGFHPRKRQIYENKPPRSSIQL